MKIETCKNMIGFFVRVFIITFCFVMDVKVKADVLVEAVSGRVEFESNHKILKSPQKVPFKLVEPKEFDVQTFENATTRFKIDEKKIGMAPLSLFSFEKDAKSQFAKGEIY